jgi:hypothetical protein
MLKLRLNDFSVSDWYHSRVMPNNYDGYYIVILSNDALEYLDIKINSRVWFGAANSNFHFKEYFIHCDLI